MFSFHKISKATALALAVGAIAAPAAGAMPIGGIPSQTRHVTPTALAPGLATYSRQDKQVVPSWPAPVSAPVAPRASTPSGGFDWTYAGIGGALALAMLGIGGAVAISQRRTRGTVSAPAAS